MIRESIQVIELLERLNWPTADRIRIVWLQVEGDRDELATAIQGDRGDRAIVPIVLRQQLFQDPNLVMGDVLRLIMENRDAFEGIGSNHEWMVLPILAKSKLKIPQVGSPVTLPEWFPICPGHEVHSRIVDLALDVTVGLLNAGEARIEEIAALLFDLEQELCKRIALVAEVDPHKCQQLVALVRRDAAVKKEELFSGWMHSMQSVTDPRGYRPSVKSGLSLGSQLIGVALKTSPDGLPTLAAALATALAVGDGIAKRQTLVSILLRPSSRLNSSDSVAHAIVTELYGAYQLLNAAAHAAEYATFSLNLVESISHDLRAGLRQSASALRGLPEQPPRRDRRG